MLVAVAVPVALLVGFAVRVFTSEQRTSPAARRAAVAALAVAVAMVAAVVWVAVEFARDYRF